MTTTATVYCPCRRTNVYVGRCNLCVPGDTQSDSADAEANPACPVGLSQNSGTDGETVPLVPLIPIRSAA